MNPPHSYDKKHNVYYPIGQINVMGKNDSGKPTQKKENGGPMLAIHHYADGLIRRFDHQRSRSLKFPRIFFALAPQVYFLTSCRLRSARRAASAGLLNARWTASANERGSSGLAKNTIVSSTISRIEGISEATMGRLEAMYSKSFMGEVWKREISSRPVFGNTSTSAALSQTGISAHGFCPTNTKFRVSGLEFRVSNALISRVSPPTIHTRISRGSSPVALTSVSTPFHRW